MAILSYLVSGEDGIDLTIDNLTTVTYVCNYTHYALCFLKPKFIMNGRLFI